MSKYTTQLRFICENYAGLDESADYNAIDNIVTLACPKIFDSDIPFFGLYGACSTFCESLTLASLFVNAGYATKNDLPSSYSRDERKLYQRIIAVIDTYFTDDPKTAEALREKIKSELSVKKK